MITMQLFAYGGTFHSTVCLYVCLPNHDAVACVCWHVQYECVHAQVCLRFMCAYVQRTSAGLFC